MNPKEIAQRILAEYPIPFVSDAEAIFLANRYLEAIELLKELYEDHQEMSYSINRYLAKDLEKFLSEHEGKE